MKKLLLTLMCLLGTLTMFADTYTFGAPANGKLTSNPFATSNTAEVTSFTRNDVAWTVSYDWATNTKYLSNNATQGYQFGKKDNPINELKLTTTGITGQITSVKVNAALASGETGFSIGVKVNNVNYTSSPDASSLSATNTDYNFTGSESGTIEIIVTKTTSTKAFYLKDIEITYSAGNTPPPAPVAAITAPSTLNLGKGASLASKTLTITGKNLTDAITYSWETGGKFTATGALTADGGTLTISLDQTTVGQYTDKLILTSGTTTAEVTVTAELITLAGTGEGTLESPYDVTRALDILAQEMQTEDEVYVIGIISSIDQVSTQYGNATYFISNDGTTTTQFEIFRGKYLNNTAFTSENQIAVGDEVVVCGKLTNYINNGTTTPELATDNYIVSIKKADVPECEITWMANGNVIETASVSQGLPLQAPADPEAPEGYAFMGWTASSTVNADGTGISYLADDATVPTETTATYYAVFAKVTENFGEESEISLTYANVHAGYTTDNVDRDMQNITGFKYYGCMQGKENGSNQASMIQMRKANSNENKISCIYNTTPLSISKIEITYNSGTSKYATVYFGQDVNPETGNIDAQNIDDVYTYANASSNNKYFRIANNENNAVKIETIKIFAQAVQISYSDYTLTPTPAVELTDVEVTIADHGFATLYYSDRNLTVPAGVSAWTFDLNTNNENILVPTEAYHSGSVIPADEAVVLYSANGGTFTFEVAETASAKDANNKLKGTDAAQTVTPENGGTLYFLGHTTQHGVAFFKGGSTITNGAHKAYLEIPTGASQAPALFSIGVDNGTTGINCITIDEDNTGDGAMYDVLGRKVDSNYKGFVIKNGKKFMNK